MRESERSRVFAVRRGELPFNDVLTEIGQLERDLADLLDTSPLPAAPDRSTVDDFLVRAHISYWNGSAWKEATVPYQLMRWASGRLAERPLTTKDYDAARWEEPPTAMDRLMEERIALNQATFREANERINAAAGVYAVDIPVPFICECADPTCADVVRLALSQYEEIRAESRHFLNVPGHQAAAQGAAAVVAEREGYVIAEKIGHAGEIAEALDKRNTDVVQAGEEAG